VQDSEEYFSSPSVHCGRQLIHRSLEGEVLKPNLVAKNRERVFVIDMATRQRDRDYLKTGRKGKIDTYTLDYCRTSRADLTAKVGRSFRL
jgi:hypothetical protein